MSSSVYNADRTTHLRIVAVALMASIAIVGLAISARVNLFQGSQITSAGMIQKAEISKNEAIAAPTVRKWL